MPPAVLERKRCTCSTAAASDEMTAFDFEYEHAKHEGVQFLWRRAALRDPHQ